MKADFHKLFKHKQLKGKIFLLLGIFSVFCFLGGCGPASRRKDMDKTAGKIISEKQLQATGKTSKFSIERPSDILRRRLLTDQNLPMSGAASLGSDKLTQIKHWPEKDYPTATSGGDVAEINDVNKPIAISLIQALQIGAYNSFDYQTQKEEIFKTALALELERYAFRSTFIGQLQYLLSTDTTGAAPVSGQVGSGDFGFTKKFETGAELSTTFAIDLANLVTPKPGKSSIGLISDMSISIPLLRGSGKHIVTENLTQADRNVVYAFWDFEQFKKEFAVDAASKYFSVLQQLDAIKNSEADYHSRIESGKRSRWLADAGRIQEIEVDQAVQNELSARQRWIAATQSYKRQLDSFKTFLGLPPDAQIELDPNELIKLLARTKQIINLDVNENQLITDLQTHEANELVKVLEPDYENAGPYEMEELTAVKLAFDNRLDLRTITGKVYDAQRAVVVAADALGAELTFLGSANYGSRRTITSANLQDAQIELNRGVSSVLLTMDLPLDRTTESVNYRNSYINLEQAVRNVQTFEDTVKTNIRDALRNLLEARENMYIQAKAVSVAQKRVRSVNMFLEAGRAQIRDLLEAQDALLAAQNSLTAAVVNYRTAELAIQRDAGVLEIDEQGLWKEYSPGGI